MTLKHSTEVLLQENPSAVCIDFNEDPSLKSLLPALKASPKLKVLEETGNYIIISCTTPTSNKKMRVVVVNRKGSNKSFRIPLKYLFRKKENMFTIFLKNVGINANSISNSNQVTVEPVVNASGIIF